MRNTNLLLKKGWTYNPGNMNRGGKNPIWRPKMFPDQLQPFIFLDFEHPRRRPDSWNEFESRRLGLVAWPKEVGFYNKGDNFELTPEMSWRLFLKNKNEEFWLPEDNEQTLINLLPIIEKDPSQQNLSKIDDIFTAHVERFGVDHIIYNAVLQAVAFSRTPDSLSRCEEIFREMQTQGLAPNAQTYVNMMLAAKLVKGDAKIGDDDKKRRDVANKYFTQGVQSGALEAVMRLDTEFQMWWDQLNRMGSFSSSVTNNNSEKKNNGFLSVNDEGAVPLPRDPFAIWGWDSRTERKFGTLQNRIHQQVFAQKAASRGLGSVFNSYKREPWHRYKGMFPHDFKGPPKKMQESPNSPFEDAPYPAAKGFGKSREKCGPAY